MHVRVSCLPGAEEVSFGTEKATYVFVSHDRGVVVFTDSPIDAGYRRANVVAVIESLGRVDN